MTNALAVAGAALGGITRVVLGHGHADHRGVAPGLPASRCYCHADEKADAEGDGGSTTSTSPAARRTARWSTRTLLHVVGRRAGKDRGDRRPRATRSPASRSSTCPATRPGLIGLWRESDRLALAATASTRSTRDRPHGPPRVPHAAFNQDTEQARASIRKLAAMEPAAAWPGHAEPLTGDVRRQLEHAAATT